MRRFVCTEGDASKFWEAATTGAKLTVRWGKLGTAGQEKIKSFADAKAASAELAKLIKEKLGKGYREEGGAPAKPSASGASGASSGSGALRCYGTAPADWFEGANEGHAYEIRFAAPPSEAVRQQLAQCYESALEDGAAVPSDEPWLWSGPWALLVVGERGDGDGDPARDAFAAMEQLFVALHAVAPIDEVIFCGARALGKRAEKQPPPSAGPRWPGLAAQNDELFGRPPADASWPKAKADPRFEAARQSARAAAAKARKAADKQRAARPQKIELKRWSTDALETERASLPPLELPDLDDLKRPFAKAGDDPSVKVGPSGRVVASYYKEDRVAFLDAGKVRAVDGVKASVLDMKAVDVRADGGAMLVLSDAGEDLGDDGGTRLFEVALPSGKAHVVLEERYGAKDGLVVSVAYAPGGAFALLSEKRLRLFPDTKPGRAPIAEAKLKGGDELFPLFDGRALVAKLEAGTQIFATDGKQLTDLWKSKLELSSPYVHAGRIFATEMEEYDTVELLNLAAALPS